MSIYWTLPCRYVMSYCIICEKCCLGWGHRCMSVAGPTVCELGQEIPLHFWTWMIHVSSCWRALLIMCTYTLTVTAVMRCCADDIFTFYSRLSVVLYTHHQFIHHWVLFNCFWVMPVPTMMLPLASLASIRRCCCYGGKVARNTRKSTKVVQHTPDEWFSKEQFSANPNWVFFSKEV